jgi:hypothetical protein
MEAALQSVLATAFGLLPSRVQGAATAVGGACFDALTAAVEAGLVPDAVIRRGIRALLRQRDGEVSAWGVGGVLPALCFSFWGKTDRCTASVATPRRATTHTPAPQNH